MTDGKAAERRGKVQTVTGLIDPADLGTTLMHEHVLSTGHAWFAEDPDAPPGCEGDSPVSLKNRWWTSTNAFCNRDNLVLDDHDTAAYELGLFRDVGGRSVVDMSCLGLRNPGHADKLRRISQTTGTNIVMGTGWYVQRFHPPELKSMDDDALVEVMVREINEGVDGTDVRAGIIGEIGISTPFDDDERRVLKAAAQAQTQTGVAISVHPGMGDILLDIVETLRDAGADLNRVVLCHQDLMGYTNEIRLEVAAAGCTLEFDTFGGTTWVNTKAQGMPIGLQAPSDTARIEEIEFFLEQGLASQIVISQDVFVKCAQATYGGTGYGHILRSMVPYM